MSRASADIADALHGLLAGALKDELERAMELARHPDPEIRQPINPQLLDKVRQFLKDNDITAPKSNGPVNNLAAELNDIDVDGEAVSLRH